LVVVQCAVFFEKKDIHTAFNAKWESRISIRSLKQVLYIRIIRYIQPVRGMKIEVPNKVWAADITYIPMAKEKVPYARFSNWPGLK